MTEYQRTIDSLRKLGHRITPQREMIIEALIHGNKHNTAEEIYQRLQTRTHAINLATVYRTMDLLVARGFATRTLSLDGKTVYATIQHGPHIHLTCRQCGKVVNADQKIFMKLNEILEEQYGFVADFQHTIILGFCQECDTDSIHQM